MKGIKKYGWEIMTRHSTGGSHGLDIYLVNHNNGYEIQVPNDKLNTFGYICHGSEAGILWNKKGAESEEEQLKALIDILSNELDQNSKIIDYHTLVSYFSRRKAKYAIETTSIYKTLKIIKEEFQSICKYKLDFVKKNRIFNSKV